VKTEPGSSEGPGVLKKTAGSFLLTLFLLPSFYLRPFSILVCPFPFFSSLLPFPFFPVVPFRSFPLLYCPFHYVLCFRRPLPLHLFTSFILAVPAPSFRSLSLFHFALAASFVFPSTSLLSILLRRSYFSGRSVRLRSNALSFLAVPSLSFPFVCSLAGWNIVFRTMDHGPWL